MKKAFAALIALVMTLGLSSATFAAGNSSYTDVHNTHWALTSIEACKTKGLMQGVGNNKFDPEGILTRAQVAQILYNAYKDRLIPNTGKNLTDVPNGTWYYDAMHCMIANGLIDSVAKSDGVYVRPDDVADRKFVALALSRLAKTLGVELPKTCTKISFPDIGELKEEYQQAITALQRAGIISGFPDGTYQPDGSLTRAQAAKLVDLYTNIDGLQPKQQPPTTPEPTNPPANTSITPDEVYKAIKSSAEGYGYTVSSLETTVLPSGSANFVTLTNSSYTIRIQHNYTTNMTDALFTYSVYDSSGAKVAGSSGFVYGVDSMLAILQDYA